MIKKENFDDFSHIFLNSKVSQHLDKMTANIKMLFLMEKMLTPNFDCDEMVMSPTPTVYW